jgi:hypothetical protein
MEELRKREGARVCEMRFGNGARSWEEGSNTNYQYL